MLRSDVLMARDAAHGTLRNTGFCHRRLLEVRCGCSHTHRSWCGLNAAALTGADGGPPTMGLMRGSTLSTPITLHRMFSAEGLSGVGWMEALHAQGQTHCRRASLGRHASDEQLYWQDHAHTDRHTNPPAHVRCQQHTVLGPPAPSSASGDR